MDRRIELIDEVIALNNAEIAKTNKAASVSRKPMSNEDRKKIHTLGFINRDLGTIKFSIIQTLVITTQGLNIEIINIKKLEEDIAEYKKMFPETAISLDNIKESLWEDYKRNGDKTGLFGLSVSPEWEDKCYGFEFNPESHEPSYVYVGICKS